MKSKQPAGSRWKPSRVVKRSVKVAGHNTSVSLEDPFWNALNQIAISRNVSVSDLITTINNGRGQYCNLSSALRLGDISDSEENEYGGRKVGRQRHADVGL